VHQKRPQALAEARVSFFIDGFNVYHSLKNNQKYRKYLWLDDSKFLKRFVSRKMGSRFDLWLRWKIHVSAEKNSHLR
jgi:hypothetical protein